MPPRRLPHNLPTSCHIHRSPLVPTGCHPQTEAPPKGPSPRLSPSWHPVPRPVPKALPSHPALQPHNTRDLNTETGCPPF